MKFAIVTALVVLGTVSFQAQAVVYQRGEVVRLRTDDGTLVTAKIIAIGGDQVRIDAKGVFVNDIRVPNAPIEVRRAFLKPGGSWAQPIPAGGYFVFKDSITPDYRMSGWGVIPAERVLGKTGL